MPGLLHIPKSGRIVFDKRSNPDDNAPPVIDPVPLWPTPMIVERCDVYAMTGPFRVGDRSVSSQAGSERGVFVTEGNTYTIPRADLSMWWVVGAEVGHVVTWTAEVEVV